MKPHWSRTMFKGAVTGALCLAVIGSAARAGRRGKRGLRGKTIPGQAGAHRGSLRRRRRHRRAGAVPGAGPRTATGPALHHREPRRAGHRHRRRLCGALRARRLHAAGGDELDAGLQPERLQEAALRSACDFSPISLVAAVPFVLVVNPSLPANSVSDLVKLAKAKPGELSYASGGMGAPHHIYMELFKSMTGTDIRHMPYRGGGPALGDVVAGHVPIMFADVGPVTRPGQEGRRQGARRHRRQAGRDTCPTCRRWSRPDLPATRQIPGRAWLRPPNVPSPIVAALNKALTAFLAEPETQVALSPARHAADVEHAAGVRRLSARRDREMGADHQRGRCDRGLRCRYASAVMRGD